MTQAHKVMKRILAKVETTQLEKDTCEVISDLLWKIDKLRGYACHDDDCNIHIFTPHRPVCTCGLREVLESNNK